jgi:nitric oxide dioxygenase
MSEKEQQVDQHMEIVDITTEFYHRMFARSPGMCPLFNEESQRNKVQHRAFAEAALAYVSHLTADDNHDVEPMLQRIAQRHCALGVSARAI